MSAFGDGVRLSVGTLTVLPTAPPRSVGPEAAGWAMALAPVVGLLLAAPAVALIRVLGGDEPLRSASPGRLSPLLVAALVVALLALLTRGLHLDGLADTADGLGSARPAGEALAVMRQSDVGPFGVLTLVLVLLVQVGSLAQLLTRGFGTPALVVALVVSRLALPVACSRGVPAARPEGLGHLVAGSVTRRRLLLSGLLALAGAALALVLAAGLSPTATIGVPAGPGLVQATHSGFGWLLAGLVATAGVPLAVAGLLLRRCVHRFGGVTGDVLGACVEVAFTASLLLACLA